MTEGSYRQKFTHSEGDLELNSVLRSPDFSAQSDHRSCLSQNCLFHLDLIMNFHSVMFQFGQAPYFHF